MTVDASTVSGNLAFTQFGQGPLLPYQGDATGGGLSVIRGRERLGGRGAPSTGTRRSAATARAASSAARATAGPCSSRNGTLDGGIVTGGRLEVTDTTVSNNIAKGGANGGPGFGGGISARGRGPPDRHDPRRGRGQRRLRPARTGEGPRPVCRRGHRGRAGAQLAGDGHRHADPREHRPGRQGPRGRAPGQQRPDGDRDGAPFDGNTALGGLALGGGAMVNAGDPSSPVSSRAAR